MQIIFKLSQTPSNWKFQFYWKWIIIHDSKIAGLFSSNKTEKTFSANNFVTLNSCFHNFVKNKLTTPCYTNSRVSSSVTEFYWNKSFQHKFLCTAIKINCRWSSFLVKLSNHRNTLWLISLFRNIFVLMICNEDKIVLPCKLSAKIYYKKTVWAKRFKEFWAPTWYSIYALYRSSTIQSSRRLTTKLFIELPLCWSF